MELMQTPGENVQKHLMGRAIDGGSSRDRLLTLVEIIVCNSFSQTLQQCNMASKT